VQARAAEIAPAEVCAAQSLPNPEGTETGDADVETALARAIDRASAAGRFDVVALLAGELQARRLSRGGVAVLAAKRRERGT